MHKSVAKKRGCSDISLAEPDEQHPEQALVVSHVDVLMPSEAKEAKRVRPPSGVQAVPIKDSGCEKELYSIHPGQLLFSLPQLSVQRDVPVAFGAFNVIHNEDDVLLYSRFLGVARERYDVDLADDKNRITVAASGAVSILNNGCHQIYAGDVLSWGYPYTHNGTKKPAIQLPGLRDDIAEKQLEAGIQVDTAWDAPVPLDAEEQDIYAACVAAAGGGAADSKDVGVQNALRVYQQKLLDEVCAKRRRQIGVALTNAGPGEQVYVQLERA